MTSFEDGLNEMMADGLIDKEQAKLLLEAEEFAEAESFDLPDDSTTPAHPWSGLTAKEISKKFLKDKVVEVAKELGAEYKKPNGKVDTELNIAINIVEKLK